MTARAAAVVLLSLVVSTAAPVARSSSPPIALVWLQMLDRSHGYALSGENADAYRLLWTSDGGRRWADVTPGRGSIHPSGPLSILGPIRLFSTTIGRGVFAVERSDDSGRSWRRSIPFRDPHGQGAGQPFALDARHLFLAVDEGAAAGSQGEALYTSSDGGHRWRLISRTSWNRPARDALPVGCDKSGFGFATPLRGWAGGYCAGGPPFFFRTDDGGHTWRRQALPAPGQCACETSAPLFFTPRIAGAYVTGFDTTGGGFPVVRVLWTGDGGDHWRSSEPPGGRAADVSFSDPRDVWISVQHRGDLRGPYDLLARTTDAGRRWQTTKLDFDLSGYRLDVLGASVAFAIEVVDRSDTILSTVDGGRSWQAIHARLGP